MTEAARERFSPWPLIAALTLIAATTLVPAAATVGSAGRVFCVRCSDRGAADALLNIALFVPLGIALGLRRLPLLKAVLAALLTSTAVELLQFAVPGRDPAFGDLLFNTLGGAFGFTITLYRRGVLYPSTRASRWLGGGALVMVLGSLWLGAMLVRPDFPHRVYYGQWTPEFGNLEHYRGRVIAARLGDIRIGSHAIRRSAEARDYLLSGVPLRVDAIAGPPPVALAPIFNLYDDRRQEVMLIGAHGSDLLLRYRMRSIAFHLDEPVFRLPNFLDVAAGDSLRLEVRRIEGGFCVNVNRHVTCPLGLTVSALWKVLLGTTPLSHTGERVLSLLWLAALFVPVGYWLSRPRDFLTATTVVIGGLIALPFTAAILATPPLDVAAAVAGLLIGRLTTRSAQARGAPDDQDVSSEDMSEVRQRSMRA